MSQHHYPGSLKESLSRQASFTVSQLSRGNSFISQTNSHGGFIEGLHTEGTIEESIKILSVLSPSEEHTGYRHDSTKFSTRDRLVQDFAHRTRKIGSGGTTVSRGEQLRTRVLSWRPVSNGKHLIG
jgi:hypothetical protein